MVKKINSLRIAGPQNYQGLSTDTKPEGSIPEGSEFYETNTGKNWIYHDGYWVEDLSMVWTSMQTMP